MVSKYHVLVKMAIFVTFMRTANDVVSLHQQLQDFCATISALYQCAGSTGIFSPHGRRANSLLVFLKGDNRTQLTFINQQNGVETKSTNSTGPCECVAIDKGMESYY